LIKSLNSIYSYYIFYSVFIVILSIILFYATKKYKSNKERIYSMFLNLNRRDIVLLSCTFLNLIFVLYLCFFIKNFNNLILYMIIVNSLVSLGISLNSSIIVFDIFHTTITVLILKLFSLIYNYLFNIYYTRVIFVLGILFMLMIVIYVLFVTYRKLELIFHRERIRRLV